MIEARNERVLAYLRTRIGKATPLNRDIAIGSGLSVGASDAAFYHLRNHGQIITRGSGNTRVITIPGEGSTIARCNAAARETLTPTMAQAEPVRVAHWSCSRCGAKDCTRHSPAFLTTGRVPAHMGA